MSTDKWIDKENMIHTHIHTHTMEYYLAIKMNEIDRALCHSMDGPRVYYAKWNKANRERQMLYDFNYMWNLKKNETNIQENLKKWNKHTNKWKTEPES